MTTTNLNGNDAAGPDPLDADPPLFAYGPRPAVTRLRRGGVVVLGVAAAGWALFALSVTSGNGGATHAFPRTLPGVPHQGSPTRCGLWASRPTAQRATSA